jgi:hypothetical protein
MSDIGLQLVFPLGLSTARVVPEGTAGRACRPPEDDRADAPTIHDAAQLWLALPRDAGR